LPPVDRIEHEHAPRPVRGRHLCCSGEPARAARTALQPHATPPEAIRNFCIIAHIDHGKSTLADRMLEITGVVDDRSMRAQYLDRMDIERERGITIKSQAVRMPWDAWTSSASRARRAATYALNMIDTPGHVDFTYEVSRSLAACEGAVLLVDAAQGIEAQTLANLYLAMENDLTIIPVLNKIDLPAAQPEKYAAELAGLIGVRARGRASRSPARPGVGVEPLLDEIVRQIPAPVGDADAPARAMIFDSVYDTYRGVVTYVRVIDGNLNPRERIVMMSTKATHELLEIGVISPSPCPDQGAGRRRGRLPHHRRQGRAPVQGRRHRHQRRQARPDALGGYRDPKPMVFSGLYPIDGSDYPDLREALDKLKLNDAALVYEPETSVALGFGFRCGFLGLLHLEIVRERLEREFGLDLISTQPNVVYEVTLEDGTQITSPTRASSPAARSPRCASPSCAPRSSRRASSSARSWSCARASAAPCSAWTTCPRSASRCATRCRWPRSSSTSSTS
jgi:GTP-binding protein LepA